MVREIAMEKGHAFIRIPTNSSSIPPGYAPSEQFGSSKEAYFRTAVNEIRHAMWLYRNQDDDGFTNAI